MDAAFFTAVRVDAARFTAVGVDADLIYAVCVYAAYILSLWWVMPLSFEVDADDVRFRSNWRGCCNLYCSLTGTRPSIFLFVGTHIF